MKRSFFLLILLAVMLIVAACSGNSGDESENQKKDKEASDNTLEDQQKADDQLEVKLKDSDKKPVGTVTLKEKQDGVEVVLDGHDLPKGTHAFHIHEKGMCEAPDYESAGGHFNPDNMKHGFDQKEGPHAGDLPNIVVGENGKIKESYLAENVTLKKGEKNSLLRKGGTSLVIHEGADDGKSQPAGDAGDRLACGVISK